MKINDIKNLKQFDVIARNINDSLLIAPRYEIYYVIFNSRKMNKVEVCQGYYEQDSGRYIFLEETRQELIYDELLLFFDVIFKAGE